MSDSDTFILKQLSDTGTTGLGVEQLHDAQPGYSREQLHERLVVLFRQGQIFASGVKRTPNGFVPEIEANWTTVRHTNCFGYDPRWGVYSISQYSLSPLTMTLEATLLVGFQIHTIAVASNGDDFAVGGKANIIKLGRLSQCKLYRDIPQRNAGPLSVSRTWCLAYSPVSDEFISGHAKGEILRWTKSGEQLTPIGPALDRVVALRYMPDGNSVLSAHQVDDHVTNFQIQLWDLQTDQPPLGLSYHKSKKRTIEKRNVHGIELLHNGDYIVSGGNDNCVRLYSLNEQREAYCSTEHTGTITCMARHPHEDKVVTGDWSGKLHMYNFTDPKQVPPRQVIEAHISRLTAVAFSPSGSLVASGSRDSQIAIWKMPEGVLLERIVAHKGWVRGLAFADDQTLISGGTDNLCKVWRLSKVGAIPTDDNDETEMETESND